MKKLRHCHPMYSESVAAADGALGLYKVLCWLPLIASRNTPYHLLLDRVTLTAAASPPSTGRPTNRCDRPSTLVSHW